MNAIEKARAKVEKLEAISAKCNGEFDGILNACKMALANLELATASEDKSGKAIIKTFTKKIERIERMVSDFVGVDNE